MERVGVCVCVCAAQIMKPASARPTNKLDSDDES